jgi:hypothetical protein
VVGVRVRDAHDRLGRRRIERESDHPDQENHWISIQPG